MNSLAFRWGRRWVADPRRRGGGDPLRATVLGLVPKPSVDLAGLLAGAGFSGELRRLVEIRAPDLAAYQDVAYARRYIEFLRQVAAREQERAPGQTRICRGRGAPPLQLMGVQDEYEVARLLLREGRTRRSAGSSRVRPRLLALHPRFCARWG